MHERDTGRRDRGSHDRRRTRGGADRGGDRGLSPVVGVILMVAITVLLAATAASFFLDFGDEMTRTGPPAMSFEASQELSGGSHELDVEVTGGPAVPSDRFHVVVSGATCGGTAWSHRFTPSGLGASATKLLAGTTLPVSQATVCGRSGTPGGALDLSSARVDVVWVGADGSHSRRVYRWEGPAA